MSDLPVNLNIAYLAQGTIRLKTGLEPARTLESVYGNTIRERAVRAQQKHSWKAGGDADGSPFSGAMVWGKAAVNQHVPLAVTSICGGREAGGLIYSFESGGLCALLEVQQLGAEEKRLWNDNRTRIRHVTVSRDRGDLAFSILHENNTANLGVKLHGEGGVKELTEGDSFDTAPRWVPGGGRKLVFQSAGIGRNRAGHFLAIGPFGIQLLDADAGEMTTLLEDPQYDYLAPQMLPDGSLLYIRRPYSGRERLHPWRILKDTLLMPFRLLYAVFQYLNFFSAMYTGRKLTSSGGAKAREMDLKQMMVWGNLVRSQQPGRPDEESADLVPASWQLFRRSPQGAEKALAAGVLAYDINDQGQILYTNGNVIFLLHPDGRRERLLAERMIEQVFFVPG
jgi:hypothetical protein